MPRKIRRPKAPSRVVAIVQERRAAQVVEEALALDRISEVIDHLPAKPGPKDTEAKCGTRGALGHRRHA
jgi:hypothetical protein